MTLSMSSGNDSHNVLPTHPTLSNVDEEYTFPSANILNYTSTLLNYFLATPGNISSDFLKNSKNDEIPPVFSPFYNNPYLKDMQAFYAKKSPILPPDPITLPVILTPSLVLPPSLLFDPRYFFVPKELLPPKKQIHPHLLPQLRYLIHLESKRELLVYVRDTCPNAITLSAKKLLSHPKPRSRKLGLKCSTSKCGSKLTSNKRNDRILQTPSMNMKNKVEVQPRKVNKNNCVVKPVHDVNVKHSLLHAYSEPVCATCKKSLFDGVHDICFLDFNEKCRTYTIVGNMCPLTMITSANVEPPKTTTSHSVKSQKPELKVYSRKLKNVKNVFLRKKAKIVESKNANHSGPNHTRGSNATGIPSSSSFVMAVRYRNDHIARIMRYGDYQLGNVTISRVYYVKGLGHNLFSVGQFCDGDLEVEFWKNTCFIRNLKGVDLLFGSRDINLYTISLDDMLKTSSIFLLSKASKPKSWLWHRQLSHLNFGKSTISSHQPKAEDTNQEKLYLLHMD
uniref:Retrovirus-related Pol polyprotein from transposon TNT 1-94 n=1 Tax=Tanacetum cinerariifolium TaxID=118510 RepID=A0A6L2KDM8_TANCI|nr:retrovirus-related Pol polyprotein from transposon TNT 1-94 [Tanacetum cinerariifolium]